MSKRYPREFRDDVVRVALARDPGVPLARIAADFGIGKSSLQNWIREATQQAPATTTTATAPADALEARELRRRVKLLEQENEVLRRAAAYFAQAHLPGK